MTTNPEIATKLDRLAEYLDRHKLDGVLLSHRANFSWITGGKLNYVASSSQNGVASILATPTQRTCFTNTIEGPRFATEELAGTGIPVVTYPWHDRPAGKKVLSELIAGRKIAADVMDTGEFDRFGAGLHKLPDDFTQLRWTLTPAEIERYREGARRTSEAIEAACWKIAKNMTEHEIAGVLDSEVRSRGLLPVVNLIAADQRLEKFRHPIPTDQRVQRHVMLVICANFAGLITNITRLVSFVPVPPDLRRRIQAVCNVDAAVNLSTHSGRTLGEMCDLLIQAYADNGCPGQFEFHHQGGSTGYAGREAFAEPGSHIVIQANQAFAWNPSVPGAKSEDTILCTGTQVEFLSGVSDSWPKVTARFGDQTIERPDILVR